MELSFFVRVLGEAKVKKILEEYVAKHLSSSSPAVSVTYKKKKFLNGMHKWSEADETDMLESITNLMKSGMKKHPAFDVVARKFGVTGGAIAARFYKLTNNDTTTTQSVEAPKQNQEYNIHARY